MDINFFVYGAIIAALAALVLALFYSRQVKMAPEGSSGMVEIASTIREGAMAFLKREYQWVAVFVVVLAIVIASLLDWGRPWGAMAYIFGAILSATAGLIGMRIATAANVRTAEAARTG